MTSVKTAIFPAAGLGTRLLPLTKAIPKELLFVGTRPLIQHAVEEAMAAGIERLVFVSSRSKPALEAHFAPDRKLEADLLAKRKTDVLSALRTTDLGDKLEVVYQDAPKGLGHAVWCARDLIGDAPFAVLLPDDFVLAKRPCLAQMIEAHAETGGNMVATMDVGREEISKYGCLDVIETQGRRLRARGLVEKPAPDEAPSTQAVIGRYILQPSVMDQLAATEPGAGGEIQLTDAIAADVREQGLWGYAFKGRRFDCGSFDGLAAANTAISMWDPQGNAERRRQRGCVAG